MEFLAVVDVEATCDGDGAGGFSKWTHEVIELPVVLVNVREGRVVDEFRRFVRPTHVPTLTPFCTRLTAITQAIVDSADTLDVVLKELDAWLVSHRLGADGRVGADVPAVTDGAVGTPSPDAPPVARKGKMAGWWSFAADGPWDLGHFIHGECTRKEIPTGPHFNRWVNISSAFAALHRCREMKLSRMLTTYGMYFEGRPHCGMDDARNIARVAVGMLARGWVPRFNESIRPPGGSDAK